MKNDIRHLLYLWTMTALTLSWSSCNRDNSLLPDETASLPSITFVTSIGGMGDNGYNDLILSGIIEFANRQDITLSIISPRDMTEAECALTDYCHTPSGHPSLLILGASEYEPLLTDSLPSLTDTQSILLFESPRQDLPQQVYTFYLRRYGAAYLCGQMAAECPQAYVIAACPDEATIQPAIQGFCQGYAQGSGQQATVTYLADDITGFSNPEQAYVAIKELPWNAFVFPLAGGSGSGIYKYVRENMFSGMLVAGMDVDCSAYSTRTPFSMVVHIDRLLSQWLGDWIQGKEIPPHMEYGLSEGFVGVTVNHDFLDNCLTWEDYYDTPDYWQNAYDISYPTAMEAERSYYEN